MKLSNGLDLNQMVEFSFLASYVYYSPRLNEMIILNEKVKTFNRYADKTCQYFYIGEL